MKAIRGGIPVVFPQFGRPSQAMSQHGFARTSMWNIGEVSSNELDCSLQLTLSSSPVTLEQWPHHFKLTYTVTLSATGLLCTLSATNVGGSSFACHTLLHTYFRLSHISEVRFIGFKGHEYTDKVQGGAVNTTSEEAIAITSEVDRVYLAPSASAHSEVSSRCAIPDIYITDATNNEPLMLIEKFASLEQNGSQQKVETDCVLWNQWREGSLGMADMDDDGFEHYVCVEPGTVSEYVSVPPEARLSLSQRLTPK